MTSEIKTRLTAAVKDAMKQGKKQELATLRLITAAFKQHEVDKREDVDDERALVILTKLAKQRRESIAQFSTAGRDDLVAQEEFELALLESYLPAALSDEEVNAEIDGVIAKLGASSPKDMGKVMGALKSALQGRADMGKVSSLVKTALSS